MEALPSASALCRIWPGTCLLIAIAVWTLFLHFIKIAVWALAYAGFGTLPDLTTAFYFSGVTYAITGYGDLVLPDEWRLVGAVEALTGILMCGLSTGMFFAVCSKIFHLAKEGSREPGKPGTNSHNQPTQRPSI